MAWRISHYPPGAAPSRDYAVRARSLDAAKRIRVAFGPPRTGGRPAAH